MVSDKPPSPVLVLSTARLPTHTAELNLEKMSVVMHHRDPRPQGRGYTWRTLTHHRKGKAGKKQPAYRPCVSRRRRVVLRTVAAAAVLSGWRGERGGERQNMRKIERTENRERERMRGKDGKTGQGKEEEER